MVNNVVHATYAETYDLNTAVNELSILGIHTPQAPQLKKMFAGFYLNYKKIKILGCNFRLVCASQQSLDPSQLGLEAGQVDPRDILNPILFKACTGESMNALLDIAYNITDGVIEDVSGLKGSISQNVTSLNTARNAYYQLLADESFRRAHPQAGLTVTGLRPMVHKVYSTVPFNYVGSNFGVDPDDGVVFPQGYEGTETEANGATGLPQNAGLSPTFVTSGLRPMPAFPTSYDGAGSGTPENIVLTTDVPRVYMGVLVLPPAILQRLFFRLTIVWHVEFSDFRPVQDIGGVNPGTISIATGLPFSSNTTYFNCYHNAVSNKLKDEHSSFSTNEGTQVEQVLEQVK